MSQTMAGAGGRCLGGTTLLLVVLLGATGCQAGGGPLARWFGRDGSPAGGGRGADPVSDNLLSRWVDQPPPTAPTLTDGGLELGEGGWAPRVRSEADAAVAAEFEAAEALFHRGDLDAAETAFARIVRKERSPLPRLFADVRLGGPEAGRSPWGMKALYYLGEIKFQQGDYVGAHDRFEELMKDYPGNNYLEQVVDREYRIGQIWLAHLSGGEDAALPWHARFRGGLPFVDTGGHAVAALEHVRLNDYKGPLADDAVMAVADHYYRKGDFESAAYHYDQLINDYPKSDLLQRAMLASIDSKMKGYIGPEYDGTGLAQATDTAHRTMELFPERQVSTDANEDLHRTLDLVADQEAERAFSVGSYYRRAGRVISAEYYFGMIVSKWPRSDWADKARGQLVELAKLPREQSRPSTIMARPGGGDPYNQGVSPGSAGAVGPLGPIGQ